MLKLRPPALRIDARMAFKVFELLLVGTAALCCLILVVPAAAGTPRILAASGLGSVVLAGLLLDRTKRKRPKPGGIVSGRQHAKGPPRQRHGLDISEHERLSLFAPASSILAPPGAPFDPETGLDTMVAPLSTPSDFKSD